MKTVKFVKEPGYVYDLLYIFVLYFNKDFLLKEHLNYDKSNEDTAFFNEVLNEFLPISDDIVLFFKVKDNGRSFLTQYGLFDYTDNFLIDYDFNKLIKVISDTKQIKRALLFFYFPDLTDVQIDSYESDIKGLSQIIDTSGYNGDIKSRLYSFFINPAPIMQRLLQELVAKEVLLSQYYQKNYQRMIDVQNNFDIDSLATKLRNIEGKQYSVDETAQVVISICLLNKNCICSSFLDGVTFEILGYDFDGYLDFLQHQDIVPELDSFGNAVSDKTRIGILEHLLVNDEITLKEVEKLFNVSNTNAHYHLTLMLKANLLKTRNQGRTVLYSLNKKYFNGILDIIKKYIES